MHDVTRMRDDRGRSDSQDGIEAGWGWWWQTLLYATRGTLNRGFCLERGIQQRCNNREVSLGRNALGIRDLRVRTNSCLAAGMLTGSHVTIARHFLATSHFRLSHVVRRKTGESRRGRP
jgi:hypothetical protein